MRLIGGKDYYDSGLAFGQDDSVLFVRTGDERMSDDEMLPLMGVGRLSSAGRLVDPNGKSGSEQRRRTTFAFQDRDDHSVSIRHGWNTLRHDVSYVQAMLCGVLRSGMHVTASMAYGMRERIDERWIWTREGLDAYVKEHGLAVIDGDETPDRWIHGDCERVSLARWFEPRPLSPQAVESVVSRRIVVATRAPGDRFRDENGKTRPWRINQPSLGEIGFAKAVDPYAAFQEISMWMGGVIPKDGPKTVQIVDDVVKLQKHGFDHPTSFRRGKADPRK